MYSNSNEGSLYKYAHIHTRVHAHIHIHVYEAYKREGFCGGPASFIAGSETI